MDITELRSEIDKIDDELLRLFCARMELSAQVADYKRERGLPIYAPAREREILQNVAQKAGTELSDYARSLYSTIFELSRGYQAKRNGKETTLFREITAAIENTPKLFPRSAMVACQGVEGAYSQLACEKIFQSPMILYFKNFEGVFSAIEKGMCRYGVLPIENSTAGSVNQVYDLMIQHNFSIVRTFRLKVDHNLLVNPGTKLEDMRPVRWQDYLNAELTAVRELKEKYPYVSVCGLSMGGDLTLIAAEQMEVTSCIPISAPMKTQVRFDWAAGALSVFVPVTYWRNGGKVDPNDPMKDYKAGYAGFPTRSVTDLRHLMHLARKNLYAISCPMLVVQSHGDHTISKDSADIILAGAGARQKEMLWLADAPHACTASKACDEIAERVIPFLRKVQNA